MNTFKKHKERIHKFKLFLGDDVWFLFIRAILIGILWFAVESSFLFVMQGLFQSLGFSNVAGPSNISKYFPSSALGASLLLIGYGIFRSAVSIVRDYYSGVTNQAFIRHQREKIAEYALNNSDTLTSYEVMSLFGETVSRASIIVIQLTQFANIATSATLLFFLGLKLAPIELIFGFALLSIFVIPLNKIAQRISHEEAGLNQQWVNANKTLQLGFKNHYFLKVNRLITNEVNKVGDSLRQYETYYKKYFLHLGIKNNAPTFAGILVLSIVMYISKVYIGTEGTKLISFFYIFIRISQAASDGNVALTNLKTYLPSFKILYQWNVVNSLQTYKNTLVPQTKLTVSENIILKMENVDFGFNPNELIIKNQNLTIKTGNIALIKGLSGSGKSTLIGLLLGVQKPTKGEVTINGTNIQSCKNDTANIIGYVGAEPFLIPGTVRENLLYGISRVPTNDEIHNALKMACIEDDVKNLNNGLEEELNEFTQLSTGQKQRLSIARAYLKEPKILVWDEATANIDEITEKACIQNLKLQANKMAIIVVSHKNSFDNSANMVITL